MDTAHELDMTLDEQLIKDLAGSRAFFRGVGYLQDGRIASVESRGDRVVATVRGTVPYGVELRLVDDVIGWTCSCPAAEDGSFCKHCAAVALSLARRGELLGASGSDRSDTTGRRSRDSPAVGGDAEMLADFVRGLARNRLADTVLEQCDRDWRLRERLLTEARTVRGVQPDVREWRRRIRDAFSTGGFLSYHEADGWAAGVNDMIEAVADLEQAGHHETVAELAEYAHQRADQAVDHIDDSGGWLSGISEALSDLHLQACTAGEPDPIALGERLAKLELASELDGFRRCAAGYAEILGAEGLTAFRRAVEPQWRKLDPSGDEWASGAFSVRQAMIGWALGTGDPDALVEAHRSDQIRPVDMAEIAAAFERAGRDDEAVEWARRGLSGLGHGSWQAGQARDLLARKLRERGRHGEAGDLYWKAFEANPSLGAYRELQRQDSETDWLARCRRHLVTRLGNAPSTQPTGTARPTASGSTGPEPSPFSTTPAPRDVMSDTAPAAPAEAATLTELLLYEGRIDDAWEAASTFSTSRPMWMTLARQREADHPGDSIPVYESEVLAIINRKKPNRYRVAADLMDRIRRLAAKTGEPQRFDALLARVRVEHKAKRRLIAELDRMGRQAAASDDGRSPRRDD